VELDRVSALLIETYAHHGARIHFVDARPWALYLGLHAGVGSITKATGVFSQKCAQQINDLRGEKGRLFRRHAVERLVEGGQTFIGLGRCIHHAAEIEKLDPDQHDWASAEDSAHPDEPHLHWSTQSVYLNGGGMAGIHASMIRRMAAHGSRDRQAQHRASITAFARLPTATEIEWFTRGSPEDPRFIGSADFVAAMCRELRIKPRPRASYYPNADAQMRRTTVRLVDAFRRMGEEYYPSGRAEKWKKWRSVVTLEKVCSESREQPVPMLRGLAASLMHNRGIPQRLIEGFLHARPRTLAASRRQHYQMKFKTLFGRPYEDLFRLARESAPTIMFGVAGSTAREGFIAGAKDRLERSATLHSMIKPAVVSPARNDIQERVVRRRRRAR
jgi:hypothetical protein